MALARSTKASSSISLRTFLGKKDFFVVREPTISPQSSEEVLSDRVTRFEKLPSSDSTVIFTCGDMQRIINYRNRMSIDGKILSIVKKEPLYIFVHLHKTGGTTLNKHVVKNFDKDEVLNLYYPKLKIDPFTSKNQNYQKLIKEQILKVPSKKISKINFVSGHFIPKSITEYFPDRKVRFITIIRDPYSRTKSLYNYFRTLYESEDEKGKDKNLYSAFLKINGKIPSFDDWVHHKLNKNNRCVILQSIEERFKSLGYNLSDFYFIGITKTLDQDLPFIYSLFGIKKFFVNQNISKNFIKTDISKRYFAKKYKKSVSIYKKAVEINKKFKKNYPNFNKIIKKVKFKQKLLRPFTQIIFDFVESLRMFSAFLRRRSKLYGRVWDTLKKRL